MTFAKKYLMSQISETDPARFYQDSPFPGRRLIACAVGIWAVGFLLPGYVLNPNEQPAWVGQTQSILALLVIPLYFVGFWKAVVGKGYPRIMFLMSLVPFLGLLILFYLPQRHDSPNQKKSEQVGDGDAEEAV